MTGRYPSLFFASGEERVVWRILGDHMVFERGEGERNGEGSVVVNIV